MARAQLERLLQALYGLAWASQRSPPALVPSSLVVRTPSVGRPAGAPARNPAGEGNACGRGVRRASQAALVWEVVPAAARLARATTSARTAAAVVMMAAYLLSSGRLCRRRRLCRRAVSAIAVATAATARW